MKLESILQTDCNEIDNLISLESIKIMNILVTEPEKYEDYVKGENTKEREEIQDFIQKMTKVSPKYTEQHENDAHSESQIATLQNLLKTELKYKCRENNDFINITSQIMHRITSGHPFEEGNKRTAFLSGSLFAINHQLEKSNPRKVAIPRLDTDLLDTLEDVADSTKTTPKDIEKVIRPRMIKQLKAIGYT